MAEIQEAAVAMVLENEDLLETEAIVDLKMTLVTAVTILKVTRSLSFNCMIRRLGKQPRM